MFWVKFDIRNKLLGFLLFISEHFVSLRDYIGFISSNPSCKDGNARFTTVLLIKYELCIIIYNFEKWLLSMVVYLQKWLTHFYYRKTYRNDRNKTLFYHRVITISSSLLNRWRFQGYRCESGIVISACRVTKITLTVSLVLILIRITSILLEPMLRNLMFFREVRADTGILVKKLLDKSSSTRLLNPR